MYAFRYCYFFVFIYLYFIVYGISKLRFKWIIFTVMIVVTMGNLFYLIPNSNMNNTTSEPYADYRDLSFKNNDIIVATWPAGPYWYGIKVNYWLEHSITGLGDEWMIAQNGNEVFTNASILKDIYNLDGEFFVLV